MDQASRNEIVNKINDVQRRLGNLHASITNFLSSTQVSIKEKMVTSEDAVKRFDEEVHQMQMELKTVVRKLNSQ